MCYLGVHVIEPRSRKDANQKTHHNKILQKFHQEKPWQNPVEPILQEKTNKLAMAKTCRNFMRTLSWQKCVPAVPPGKNNNHLVMAKSCRTSTRKKRHFMTILLIFPQGKTYGKILQIFPQGKTSWQNPVGIPPGKIS